MKALSLWQPWASAIELGLKRIETRSWETKYRGPLAIHAALSTKADDACENEYSDVWLNGLPMDFPAFAFLPRGCIIAVADLVECAPTDSVAILDILSEQELGLGDFSDGRFGWVLENVRPVAPRIAYRGRQRLFDIPDDLLRSYR